MSVNRVTIVGNLGADPKLHDGAGSKAVCYFSVATNESYRDKNGQIQTHTEWHSVTAFGKLAELSAKFLQKGSHVYLEGRLRTEEYVGGFGERRKVTKILAHNITFLNGAKASAGEAMQENNFQKESCSEASTIFDLNDVPA